MEVSIPLINSNQNIHSVMIEYQVSNSTITTKKKKKNKCMDKTIKKITTMKKEAILNNTQELIITLTLRKMKKMEFPCCT